MCFVFTLAEFSVYILRLLFMPLSDTNKITTKINQKKRPTILVHKILKWNERTAC